ncbi:MAG: leucine-rich repeat protein [Clostridia bacterium]|nr:leucine-rich repeat protein [Clostridia bacterium]
MISYQTGDINFDEFTNNVKEGILAKEWVKDLKESKDGDIVVFEVTSKVQKILVELSPNGSISIGKKNVISGEDIFNYEIVDGNVCIIGLNFENIDYTSRISNFKIYGGFDEISIDSNMLGYREGKILITDAKKIKIPSQIDGKNVTEICWKSHLNIDIVDDIAIRGIEEIEYPETLKKISNDGKTAFLDIKTVTLNDGLEEIGNYAFWDYGNVKSLKIPSSVMKISGRPFIGMASNIEVLIEGKDSLNEFSIYDSEFDWKSTRWCGNSHINISFID